MPSDVRALSTEIQPRTEHRAARIDEHPFALGFVRGEPSREELPALKGIKRHLEGSLARSFEVAPFRTRFRLFGVG